MNKDNYDGEWARNKRNGYGIMQWADGDRYAGGWKDDKRDGEGIMVLSNGIKIK